MTPIWVRVPTPWPEGSPEAIDLPWIVGHSTEGPEGGMETEILAEFAQVEVPDGLGKKSLTVLVGFVQERWGDDMEAEVVIAKHIVEAHNAALKGRVDRGG